VPSFASVIRGQVGEDGAVRGGDCTAEPQNDKCLKIKVAHLVSHSETDHDRPSRTLGGFLKKTVLEL